MEEKKKGIFRRHIEGMLILLSLACMFYAMCKIEVRLRNIESDLTVVKTIMSVQPSKSKSLAYEQNLGTCHICGAPMGPSGECANGHRPNPPGPDPDRG